MKGKIGGIYKALQELDVKLFECEYSMCGSFSVSCGRQEPSATSFPCRTITKPWRNPWRNPFVAAVSSHASIQLRIALDETPCDSGVATLNCVGVSTVTDASQRMPAAIPPTMARARESAVLAWGFIA